jgi:hypothetical protein
MALPGQSDSLASMPSSLAGMDKAELNAAGAAWPQGSAAQSVTGGLPLAAGLVLGLAYQDEHVADFSLADPQGGWVGGLGGELDQFSLGLGKGLGSFSLGASLQGEQAMVSTHPPMRLGALASLGWQPSQSLCAGLSAGIQGKDGQALARAATAYGLDEGSWGRLTLGLVGQLWQMDSGSWGLGLEQGLWRCAFVRAGFEHQSGQPVSQGQLGTCGLGLKVWDARMDYALVMLGSAGLGQVFSLGYQFAPEPQGTPTPLPALPPPPELPSPTSSATPAPKALSEQPMPSPTPTPGMLALPGAQTQMDLGSDPLGQGDALAAQGRDKEAVDAYLEALRLESGDLLAWKALARAYGRLQRADWAQRCWQKALQLAPNDAEAQAALAQAGPKP